VIQRNIEVSSPIAQANVPVSLAPRQHKFRIGRAANFASLLKPCARVV
jgi:hypothetical protein